MTRTFFPSTQPKEAAPRNTSALRTYLLALGKNPVLSAAEALNYLDARGISYDLVAYSALPVDQRRAEHPGPREPTGHTTIRPEASALLVFRAARAPLIDHLGGSLKLLEALAEQPADHPPKRLLRALSPLIDAFPHDKKHGIAVSGYGSAARDARNALADLLVSFLETNRIPFSILPQKSPALSHTDLLAKRVLDHSMELSLVEASANGKPMRWLCRTLQAHDPHQHRLRDTGRPRQRAIYSIPPRLAKILLNLARARPDTVVLDPFCGVGAVVQEAALLGARARGTDRSRECIKDCAENIAWLEKRSKLAHPVSLRTAYSNTLPFPDNSIDAIATESDMGPPLKYRPNPDVAKRIIKSLSAMYTAFLCEGMRVLRPGARMVVVTPRFLGRKWDMGIDVKALAERFGGRRVDPLPPQIPHSLPLLDFTERHRTVREITVVEKLPGKHVNVGRYQKIPREFKEYQKRFADR